MSDGAFKDRNVFCELGKNVLYFPCMENNEKQEILKAIETVSTTLSEKIDTKIESLSEKIDTEVGSLSEQISGLANYMDERLAQTEENVNKRLAQTETRVVTKDYLDSKLADLQGNLHILMRKEDDKVVALVELLRSQKTIKEEDARRILGMDLFPKTLLTSE